MQEIAQKYDIVVVGGGMVGALTANLLADQALSVLVVEPWDIRLQSFAERPCLRTSAFNRFSLDQLQSLDVWQYVEPARRAPYVGLETWEKPNAKLSFAAQDIGEQFLGHILENNQVQRALWMGFESRKVDVRCPDSVKGMTESADGVTLTLDSGAQVEAGLVVAADGGNSKIRQMAKIGTEGWQYSQHCMAINVAMSEEHPQVTWQEFNPSGPRAYLPLYGNYASLIWYDRADTIAKLKALPLPKLSDEVRAAFPDCLGSFEAFDKGAFALTRMHAKRYHAGRVVLVGDAAHTINPLAGQGVNLGFKDAHKLAQCVSEGLEKKLAPASASVLEHYQSARYKHNLLMMSAMDVFNVSFGNDLKPLSVLRNLGLALADKAGPVKNQVMRYAMGL